MKKIIAFGIVVMVLPLISAIDDKCNFIIDYGKYCKIEIEGCNYIHHAGYPMLP